jgi:hypothetical protein
VTAAAGYPFVPCVLCGRQADVTVGADRLCIAHGRIRAHCAAAIAHRRAGDHVRAAGHAAAASQLCAEMLTDPDEAARLVAAVLAGVAPFDVDLDVPDDSDVALERLSR